MDVKAERPMLQALWHRLTGRALKAPSPYPPGKTTELGGLIAFSDLSEFPDPSELPPLDRPGVDQARLTPEQQAWRRDGVVILPGFLPDSLLDPYIRRREALNRPAGWLIGAPYLHVPELRDVALQPKLMGMLEHLIGEPMLLHLNLTAWISTEREWHQDDYLNPPFVNSWYAAVWIALDDIAEDSGPFEWVPGSHRWGLVRGEKCRAFLTAEERARTEVATGVNEWPKYAERFLTPAVEAEIARTGSEVRRFLARKGDVLIWHGRLMHRGSIATTHMKERRSLIAHYSGINHRQDMIVRRTDENGQAYAFFNVDLDE